MEKTLTQKPSDCLKFVLFGPESTGKTTLAKQLAAHYNTRWVPEYMREYLQKKWDVSKKKCEREDLLPIAYGQMHWENELSEKTSDLLFCDTNLLELKVYSEYYYNGFCPSEIEEFALKNEYTHYFLTYIDTKWVFDDLRDRPDDREKMFCIFENELTNQKLPFSILKGTQEERFTNAVRLIDEKTRKRNNVI
ncbi:AAA family ATPase [Cochleicola gelatinilyticus]|uniref:Nicotinate-nucleotide adenylyltransferase n=1 Tax=Cochleicola gelatinilyticus TaxID=1763537 RepID=A0A167ITF5_9FLAO|nr:ATP-binding protein [Cochleicola gelatinilyticus]OAB80001.1 nicotinate-nucleotide adenylyltransferase [Cochleicola gelatinilyticus]